MNKDPIVGRAYVRVVFPAPERPAGDYSITVAPPTPALIAKQDARSLAADLTDDFRALWDALPETERARFRNAQYWICAWDLTDDAPAICSHVLAAALLAATPALRTHVLDIAYELSNLEWWKDDLLPGVIRR